MKPQKTTVVQETKLRFFISFFHHIYSSSLFSCHHPFPPSFLVLIRVLILVFLINTTYKSVSPSILYTYLYIYQSIYLSTNISIYLSIYLYVYLSISFSLFSLACTENLHNRYSNQAGNHCTQQTLCFLLSCFPALLFFFILLFVFILLFTYLPLSKSRSKGLWNNGVDYLSV